VEAALCSSVVVLVVESASLLRPQRSNWPPLVAVNRRFPKSRRLRKRADYLAVQRTGKTQHSRYFVVVSECRAGDQREGRLGITVSKKVGNAVIRNRVKRVVREFARTATHPDRGQPWLPSNLDVVVIAKRDAATAPTADLWADLAASGSRLQEESARC
jgi:ribonuclease P protein component